MREPVEKNPCSLAKAEPDISEYADQAWCGRGFPLIAKAYFSPHPPPQKKIIHPQWRWISAHPKPGLLMYIFHKREESICSFWHSKGSHCVQLPLPPTGLLKYHPFAGTYKGRWSPPTPRHTRVCDELLHNTAWEHKALSVFLTCVGKVCCQSCFKMLLLTDDLLKRSTSQA